MPQLLAAYVAGRRAHVSPEASKDATWSPANTVTVVRAVVGLGLLALATMSLSAGFLAAAVLVCWLGDMADGAVARGFRCESVLGAQLDSYADRVVAFAVLLASVFVAHGEPALTTASVVCWVQFGLVDQFMSSQFLRFGLWTSDEFHLVSAGVWRLNFAPPAKAISNVPAALIVIGGEGVWAAGVLSVTLLVVRVGVYAHNAVADRLRQPWTGVSGAA